MEVDTLSFKLASPQQFVDWASHLKLGNVLVGIWQEVVRPLLDLIGLLLFPVITVSLGTQLKQLLNTCRVFLHVELQGLELGGERRQLFLECIELLLTSTLQFLWRRSESMSSKPHAMKRQAYNQRSLSRPHCNEMTALFQGSYLELKCCFSCSNNS